MIVFTQTSKDRRTHKHQTSKARLVRQTQTMYMHYNIGL